MLLQQGGPADVASVYPFLRHYFADREMLPVRGGPMLQSSLARVMAMYYAPRLKKSYRSIGGRSPLLHYMERQASGVQQRLRLRGRDARVVYATHYLEPSVEHALEELCSAGRRQIFVVFLHPQYSMSTTGALVADLKRAVTRSGRKVKLRFIDRWYGESDYLDLMATHVREAIEGFPAPVQPQVRVLFCAHSIPLHFVEEEHDPYRDDLEATLQGILSRLPYGTQHRVALQPGPGPLRWLGPSLETAVCEWARDGARHLLCMPLSFVCDHIETLYEIDLVIRERAERAGVEDFRRAAALNDDPRFLDVLTGLVERRLT